MVLIIYNIQSAAPSGRNELVLQGVTREWGQDWWQTLTHVLSVCWGKALCQTVEWHVFPWPSWRGEGQGKAVVDCCSSTVWYSIHCERVRVSVSHWESTELVLRLEMYRIQLHYLINKGMAAVPEEGCYGTKYWYLSVGNKSFFVIFNIQS